MLEPYAGPSEYRHHGRRVVEGQRLMQAASDTFLGWVEAEGLDATLLEAERQGELEVERGL